MTRRLQFTLNGRARVDAVPDNLLLLYYLRGCSKVELKIGMLRQEFADFCEQRARAVGLCDVSVASGRARFLFIATQSV
jgi:hypothetical protein